MSAELPGVAREDLEVFVQEGVLTIRGARRFGRREAQAIEATTAGAEPAEAEADAEAAEAAEAADASAAETEDASALRFERRIRFNGDVDEDAVSARYADGLLEVGVPRLVPPEPEVRTIPIQVA